MLRSRMLRWHRFAPRRALLMLALFALALGSLPSARPTQADGPAVLLKDVIPGTTQTYPSQPTPKPLATVGNTHFFIYYDFNNGYDLWKSDGTAAGTVLVKDVFPADPINSPASFSESAAAGSLLFFTTSDGSAYGALWRSDGTAAGTFQLKTLGPDRLDGPSRLTAVGATLYFVASDAQGPGLWKSDGTEAGTQKVKTLAGTRDDTYGLASVGGLLFFVSSDGTHGRELWKSDGTETGTQMVADLNPGGDAFETSGAAGASFQLAPLGSDVVFRATDGAKSGLWRSQGAAIEYLANLAFDQGISAGAELYFSTTNGSLGKTDGTAAGTALIKADVFPARLTSSGGQVFFLRQPSGQLQDGELWKTDGTEAGTLKVAGDSQFGFQTLVAGSAKLFLFRGNGTQHELWVSDGSQAGTAQLSGISPTTSFTTGYLAVLGGKVLFGAYEGQGPAVWISDGTPEGTTMLKNASLVGESLLDWYRRGAAQTVAVGDHLFISADDKLWHSDGTPGGTRVIKTFDTPDRVWLGLVAAGSGVSFFSATEGGIRGLWRSDGTPEGTVRLKQFGELEFGPGRALLVQNLLYFVTGTKTAYQFWRTDGTAEGTVPLFSLERTQSPPTGDFPRDLTMVGGKLFFTYSDAAHGRELWVSDGSQAGTRLVKDLDKGEHFSSPYGLANLNGTLVFIVSSHTDGTYPARGYSLWRSDGSAAGTALLAQFDYINNVPAELAPGQLTALGSKLFFTAWDKDTGNELWVSDGTVAGTHRLKDINTVPIPYYDVIPGASKNNSSAPHDLTAVGGKLLFAADDGIHGDELWKTDGTEEGTALVKDIYPGTLDARISQIRMAPATGRVVFAASDGLAGVELWSSDGSAAGTQLLSEMAPGASSSNPTDLMVGQRQLFFLADDGQAGGEPWALSLSALPSGGRTQIFLPLLRK